MKKRLAFYLLSMLLTISSCQSLPSSNSDNLISSQSDNRTSDLISSDDTLSSTDEKQSSSSSSSFVLQEGMILSPYQYEGRPFGYRDLTTCATFEEDTFYGPDYYVLTDLGDAKDDEFIYVPEEVNGKKVKSVKLSANSSTCMYPKFILPKSIEIFRPKKHVVSILFEGNQRDWLENKLNLFESADMNDLYLLNSNNFEKVEDLVIEEGVETIGKGKFSRCTIRSLTTPSSLRKIDVLAFAYCSLLSDLTFNEGLEEVKSSAFDECMKIQKLKLPSTIKTLNNGAFFLPSLISLEVPNCNFTVEKTLSHGILAHKLYRFINNSSDTSLDSYSSIKITKENQDSGGIFVYQDYVFGICNDELTLLLYVGNDQILHLPTTVPYKDKTYSSYAISEYCFERNPHSGPNLEIAYGFDYQYNLTLIKDIYIPANITSFDVHSFDFTAITLDETYYIQNLYFDMSKEVLDNLFSKLYIFWTCPFAKIYCKDNNDYVQYIYQKQ